MTIEQDDRWPDAAREALADARRDIAPPPAVERRTVRQLRRDGMTRSAWTGPSTAWSRWAAAIAIAAASFAGGMRWSTRASPPDAGPRFMLLLYGGAGDGHAAEYAAWMREVADRGVEISGDELGAASGRVAGDPGSGPAADLRGYFIVSARDVDAARALASSSPHVKYGGWIDVRPIVTEKQPQSASLPLRYDEDLERAGFPSPVVELSVGGVKARFLIDTGASVHTLARWFVDAAAIHAAPSGRTATGSTGASIDIDVVSSLTAARDDGATVRLSQAIVVDLPGLFADHRIGGLLSPQLLAPDGDDAVLDLRVPSLTFAPAVAVGAGEAHVCVNRNSPFRNRVYATSITVDGVGASVLVDSGATRSVLSQDSAAGRALAPRSTAGGATRGVGTTASEATRDVPGVRIHRGGADAAADVSIGKARGDCGPDGLLGMNALRTCTLVLGAAGLSMSCGGGT